MPWRNWRPAVRVGLHGDKTSLRNMCHALPNAARASRANELIIAPHDDRNLCATRDRGIIVERNHLPAILRPLAGMHRHNCQRHRKHFLLSPRRISRNSDASGRMAYDNQARRIRSDVIGLGENLQSSPHCRDRIWCVVGRRSEKILLILRINHNRPPPDNVRYPRAIRIGLEGTVSVQKKNNRSGLRCGFRGLKQPEPFPSRTMLAFPHRTMHIRRATRTGFRLLRRARRGVDVCDGR